MVERIPRLGIIGECMMELSGTPLGRMQQYFGGDTLNTAVYLARLHHNKPPIVHYITAMGNDALCARIIEHWRGEGIDTRYVLIDPVRTLGAYQIVLNAQGERAFIYWRGESAASHLVRHPEFPALIQDLENMDMLYLSGISLAILSAKDRECLVAHLEHLVAMGKTLLFDSNYRPQLWANQGGVDAAKRVYQRIMACTDLALLTDDDEQKLWHDAHWRNTLARLKQTGVKAVVLKRGQQGCLYQDFSEEEPQHIPTQQAVTVRDTTAAGDAFNAAFIYGLLHNKAPEHCGRMGNALAGVVIEHPGALVDPAALHDVITWIHTDENLNRPA